MLNRRAFLGVAGSFLASLAGCATQARAPRQPATWVNDIHSKLNGTRVRTIVRAESPEAVAELLRQAREAGGAVAICGGRHAMGGQQFGSDAFLLDTRSMNRVLRFDAASGTVEVEAGIQWPDLYEYLIDAQESVPEPWGIRQKQTGANRLTIGGAVAANIHGRGLSMPPFVNDIESLSVIAADGNLLRCSRTENKELFSLVIGGYGLFGVVYSVTLRLAPRIKVQRIVEVGDMDTIAEAFRERIDDGYLFGDFQFGIDPEADHYLRNGVFSCYRPAPRDAPIPPNQRRQSLRGWRGLLYLAHTDKSEAYRRYLDYYRSTSGQVYWSDTHQLSGYIDDYHLWLDRRLRAKVPATEMITELYVPRARLAAFMSDARTDLRARRAEVIYGTVRLVEKDVESFLPWATQPWACVIFNLHVEHSPQGVARAAEAFRALIDLAIAHSGSYYLTYHRWARKDQLLACYPQFEEFLRLKRRYDPEGLFQSDWYRHYASKFA
jgi:FAD/FMN-containing dehydrogenase